MEEEYREENKEEIIDYDMSDDFQIEDVADIPDEINEEDEPLEGDDLELRELESKLDKLQNEHSIPRFPRSETKTDFASGIINSHETKKICNLNDDDITDLVEKRKFYNFLEYFGWDGLATRVINNVRDVEDYSLSNKGKLLDSVFIDRSRNEAKNIQEERRTKN